MLANNVVQFLFCKYELQRDHVRNQCLHTVAPQYNWPSEYRSTSRVHWPCIKFIVKSLHSNCNKTQNRSRESHSSHTARKIIHLLAFHPSHQPCHTHYSQETLWHFNVDWYLHLIIAGSGGTSQVINWLHCSPASQWVSLPGPTANPINQTSYLPTTAVLWLERWSLSNPSWGPVVTAHGI